MTTSGVRCVNLVGAITMPGTCNGVEGRKGLMSIALIIAPSAVLGNCYFGAQ